MEQLAAAFGLGIAGIDPLGAVLLMTAIAVRASRTKTSLFMLAVFISTVVVGIVVSLLGDGIVRFISDVIPPDTSSIWLCINIGLVILISIWLVHSLRKDHNKKKPRKKSQTLTGTTWQFIAFGALFGISTAIDPTFVANAAIAAQTGSIFAMIGLHTVWLIVSQCMLFVLFVAYLFGVHRPLITWAQRAWKKLHPHTHWLLVSAALLAIIILVIDSIIFLVRGTYLF